MSSIKSQRAKKLLENPRFFKNEIDPAMKKFPGSELSLWVKLDWEGDIVKNLSFFGEISDEHKVLLESMASLLINKPISKLDDISVRECEAFLRDRNSEKSIDEMTENHELIIKKVFQWIRTYPRASVPKTYEFSSEKGPFRQLKLVDKIREIKAFLNSPEILTLYQNMVPPELVDVEDLTVYILAPYGSQREKSLFEELHVMGVEMFQEENLNFIPEAS
jgi:hypothetical protein